MLPIDFHAHSAAATENRKKHKVPIWGDLVNWNHFCKYKIRLHVLISYRHRGNYIEFIKLENIKEDYLK